MGTHQGLGGAMFGAEEGDFPPNLSQPRRSEWGGGAARGTGSRQHHRNQLNVRNFLPGRGICGINVKGQKKMVLTPNESLAWTGRWPPHSDGQEGGWGKGVLAGCQGGSAARRPPNPACA